MLSVNMFPAEGLWHLLARHSRPKFVIFKVSATETTAMGKPHVIKGWLYNSIVLFYVFVESHNS